VNRRVGVPRTELALTVACALCGVAPVFALLAWVYGLGPFAVWFWGLGAPGVVFLALVGFWLSRSGRESRLRTALYCGVVGGLIGVVGYDLVRIPQVLVGIRPYIPIESYGLLMLNATNSSAGTELAGWTFNFINGVGFGISYAVVALGRRWYWAVGWAFVLETITVVSPFAAYYQLAGKWDLIAMAYLAHIAYGYPLGKIVEAGDRFRNGLNIVLPRAVPVLLGAAGLGLVVWHWPLWTAPPGSGTPIRIANGQFAPRWARVPVGGCITVLNTDQTAYTIREAIGAPTVAPGQEGQLCFDGYGVVRARTSSLPDAGGIVLVDPAMAR
jgi:hypothetical protein